MSRDPPQRRKARRAKRRCALQPGVSLPGCEKRRKRRARAAHPFTDAASVVATEGWKPAARRAGQRQLCWLGAKHDSPGSRQGSRPASAKSVREYQQENEQAQAAYYHRQEKKLTHWPEKTITRHEKKSASEGQKASGMALFLNLILFSGIFRGVFVRQLRTDLAIMLQPHLEILSQMFRLLSGHQFSDHRHGQPFFIGHT